MWDALNRLVRVRKADNTLLATYTYDALGRRVRKNVVAALQTGVPAQALDLVYSGWRCVEERNASNVAHRQYVWGIYLDELIDIKLLQSQNDFGTGVKLYPLQDLLYRTTALCDASGVLREAYDFDAYGNTLIYRNDPGAVCQPPAPIDWTDTPVNYPACDFLYTGQRYDAESEIYNYKMRYYAPGLGRFLGRDPLGYGGGINPFEYCHSRPVDVADTSGMIGHIAGGALIGCAASASYSAIYSLFAGDNFCTTCCKAGVSCLFGAIAGAISALAPTYEGCIVGMVSGLTESVTKQICSNLCGNPSNKNVTCAVVTSIITGIGGCWVKKAAGAEATEVGEKATKFLWQLAGRVVGADIYAICRALTNDDDLLKDNNACCTFSNGSAWWSETLACPSSDAASCCKRRATGWIWDWRVVSSSAGRCHNRFG